LIGPAAGGGTIVALTSLFSTYRARQERDRDALYKIVAQLRALGPAEQLQSFAAIEDVEFRAAIAHELANEGTIEREGDIERFAFPASFQRWARRRYWTNWALSAAFLSVAAFLGDLATGWRIAWIVSGICFLVAVWRASKLQSALATVIEWTPFHLSEVWPDGTRRTLMLGRGLELLRDADGDLLLRSSANATAISISSHRIGFGRLSELLSSRVSISSSAPVS